MANPSSIATRNPLTRESRNPCAKKLPKEPRHHLRTSRETIVRVDTVDLSRTRSYICVLVRNRTHRTYAPRPICTPKLMRPQFAFVYITLPLSLPSRSFAIFWTIIHRYQLLASSSTALVLFGNDLFEYAIERSRHPRILLKLHVPRGAPAPDREEARRRGATIPISDAS
ncbi:hypothetical protein C8J57DRAFT_70776 [Mycena rebaudengoi]|nr:hypothetical protein C8J57DRAFT_70776 [Mycena rebaudengoi]